MRTFTPSGSPRRPHLAAWVVGLLLLSPMALWAQTSGQTIRLVVGYAPGGPVDAAARLFAPALGRELGQTVVVENKPGAGGAMGGDMVAKAAPNGLQLFFAASPTMTISPHVLKAMPFDPAKDVTPIAPILSYANVLVVNKDQPFKTVPELVAYAKKAAAGGTPMTYALDGRLMRAPHVTEELDPDTWRLTRVAVDTWAGFVFVHLTPESAGPLADSVAGPAVHPDESSPRPRGI